MKYEMLAEASEKLWQILDDLIDVQQELEDDVGSLNHPALARIFSESQTMLEGLIIGVSTAARSLEKKGSPPSTPGQVQ